MSMDQSLRNAPVYVLEERQIGQQAVIRHSMSCSIRTWLSSGREPPRLDHGTRRALKAAQVASLKEQGRKRHTRRQSRERKRPRKSGKQSWSR